MEIISLYAAYSSQKHLEVLSNGGIVIYPSSNCYGICCDIFNQKAVDTISRIKNRPKTKPFTLLVKHKKHFAKYGRSSASVDGYLKKYPELLFTFIVQRSTTVPLRFNPGSKTIGIMIAQGIEHRLFNKYPNALINTSANKSSLPPCFDIQQIKKQLQDALKHVTLIIDGGILMPAEPSIIIDIGKKKHEILRGAI